MKRCGGCKQTLPLDRFGNNRRNADGREFYCRECKANHHKKWYRKTRGTADGLESFRRQRRDKYASDHGYREMVLSGNRRWDRTPQGRHAARVREARRRELELATGSDLSREEWLSVLALQDERCACCSEPLMSPERDHIIPVAMGGSLTLANTQALCRSCNARKADKAIDFRTASHRAMVAWMAGEAEYVTVPESECILTIEAA